VLGTSGLAGALIGGAITGVVSLLGFVYGLGRLREQVASLKENVNDLKTDLAFRLDKMDDTLGDLRERMAKLEANTGSSIRPE